MIYSTSVLFLLIPLFILIPTGLLSILEYFLAKLESPWPGRVLPILSIINSLCICALLAFNMMGSPGPRVLLLGVVVLALLNIPTVVFLLVYFHTRKKYIQQAGIHRMNVQDL